MAGPGFSGISPGANFPRFRESRFRGNSGNFPDLGGCFSGNLGVPGDFGNSDLGGSRNSENLLPFFSVFSGFFGFLEWIGNGFPPF